MREGNREDGGGEGEVGERRRKNVRFMELGKLKVIKSKDYSTAKLLKFLREVEGFRLVLNSKALRGQHIYIIHIFLLFCPLFSLHLQSFFFYTSQSISGNFKILIQRTIRTSHFSLLPTATRQQTMLWLRG